MPLLLGKSLSITLSRIYIGKELVWAFSPLFCALAFLFVRPVSSLSAAD